MAESIRLLLVGSNAAVRRGLELFLSGEADVQVVGQADDADSAIRLGRELMPTAILIDLESFGDKGLEDAAEIRRQIPASVVLLSLRDDPRIRRQADAVGVRLVNKQAGSNALLAALRS